MPTPEELRAQAAVRARLGAQASFQLDPFTFVIQFLPLTASQTLTDNFITQADSGFAIVKTTYVATDSADAAVANLLPFGSGNPAVVPFLVTLSDSGSGRDLMNTGVHIDNLFGTAARPFIWAKVKVLDPNSTFAARVQNLSATSRNLRLAFHGFKIFGNVGAFRAHAK